jgi:A/G-specific adenine glycosylase
MAEPTAGNGFCVYFRPVTVESLLSWYRQNGRKLPWRGSSDPYRVWVSEIMLQQTRVDTVLPRYDRFLERFPDIEALAAATEDEVVAEWSGLGYYRRARQLHRAAGILVERGEGFPDTMEGWRALPGIGDYTSAAISSIVYGVPEPVLDGNVARVISRLERFRDGMATAAGRRRLRERARDLIEPESPGDSNQALMEVGATICTPRAPDCPRCPLSNECRAHAAGEPEAYPEPRRRRRTEHTRRTAVVVFNGEKTLLFRRPVDEDVLNGFWEVPWVDHGADSLPEALNRRYGGSWRVGEPAGTVRHAITHRALEVEIRRGELLGTGDLRERPEAGWFDATARARLPLSSLVAKILRAVAPDQPPCVP